MVSTLLLTLASGAVLAAVGQGDGKFESGQTHFAKSADGTRIAYDVAGGGPPLILLHGGGQDRRVWRDSGYVARLSGEFSVISIDLRGNGQSDKPTVKAAYAIDRLIEDVLAVADAVGAPQFALWGFSYGANVGRYVAARSDRVRAMVSIGIPFGPAADPAFRSIIEQRIQDGTAPPLVAAWTSALLGYPAVEPSDLRCPTLWLVGTANASAMDSAKRYQDRLADTHVQLALLDGLTHPQELERIDVTFPRAIAFMRTAAP